MARFGLCGPAYQAQSLSADAQSCVNWYLEHDESGAGKSEWQLYPTPGLSLFATLAGLPVKALETVNGRMFAVAGSTFCELMSNGAILNVNAVATDANPATISYSPTELLITSGGKAYSFILATNAFAEIDTLSGAAIQGAVSMGGYSDGYFIVLIANSQKFQISALLDVTSWNPLDITQVSVFPDNIISMKVDHREIWLFGSTKTVPYVNTGNPDFPFEPITGSFIEQGIGAQWSVVKADNKLYWWGADERGAFVGWRSDGYIPVRVSNHAIENAIQGYSTASDAVSYSYQDGGHIFWVTYFPLANKTWVYDIATQQWHERKSNIGGVQGAHLSRCHVYAFGKHLVGDWNSGKVYQMSQTFLDDAGTPITRVRRAPHISSEDEWTFHESLQIIADVGLATLTDGAGNPIGPTMMLRWSNDSTRTWSNEVDLDCGQTGEYLKRIIARRLGRARDRVYEISTSDPIPWRIVDAYLKASPGFVTTPRLADQMRKQA